MSRRKVVMFDMDGVLADFREGYREVQVALGQKPTMSPAFDAYYDDAVWAAINDSSNFWSTLPRLVGPTTLLRIDSLQRTHDVYFVTNRSGRAPKYQTEQWLFWAGVREPTVILSGRKGEMAAALRADFAIDDKAGNAVFTAYHSPKTQSFVLDADYNRFDHTVIGSSVRRAATVDEFLNEVTA